MTTFKEYVDATGNTRIDRRSVMRGGLAVGLSVWMGKAKAEPADLCVVGKDGWLFLSLDGVRRTDLPVVRQTAQLVNKAVATLKAAKIDVVISHAPAKSRIYPDYLPGDAAWATAANQRYDVVLDELRRAGTLVPDQAALFHALRRSGSEDLFFKADTHWTGSGAEQSSILVGNAIKQKFRLTDCGKPAAKLAAAASITQERNDLSGLLPAADRGKYPSQTYRLRRVMEQDGRALLDEDEADIAVVGNSFMQPAYGFANVLAETLDRPVSLQWKAHPFSPYHTMLKFVQSDAFKRQPPKLIVWGFNETDMESPCTDRDAWGQTAMAPTAFLRELHDALHARPVQIARS